MKGLKKLIRLVTKAIGGFALLVFLLAPVNTFDGLAFMAGAVIVASSALLVIFGQSLM